MAGKKNSPKTRLTGNDVYLNVQYKQIELLPPPVRGEKTVLFNPRGMDGTAKYTRKLLETLIRSIQIDGLQQPLIVRVLTKNGVIKDIQLLAGHGRYHAIGFLIAENAPVYDDTVPKKDRYVKGEAVIYQGQLCKVKAGSASGYTLEGEEGKLFESVPVADLYPTVPAAKKYANVPCKAAYDIDDWHAMRLAVDENDKRRDLDTSEEVALVEYYLAEGFTQDQICRLIDQNPTWVSQTATFRHKLPKAAFERLMVGEIKRHVAVGLLSFPEEKRQTIFDAAVEAEKQERQEALTAVADSKIEAEDAAAIANSDLKNAKAEGDEKKQAKAERELTAAKRAERDAKKKAETIKANAGKIDQGHLQRGAAKVGAKPKKVKPLDRQQLLELQASIEKLLKNCKTKENKGGKAIIEPLSGEEVSPAALRLVAATINAVCAGNYDPLEPIRAVYSVYGETPGWKKLGKKLREEEEEEDEPSDSELSRIEDVEEDDYDDGDEQESEEEFLAEYSR